MVHRSVTLPGGTFSPLDSADTNPGHAPSSEPMSLLPRHFHLSSVSCLRLSYYMFWASVLTSEKPPRTLLPHWSSASAPTLHPRAVCSTPPGQPCLPQRLIQHRAGHREGAQETSKEGQARSGLQFWAGACSCPMSLPPWLRDSASLPPTPTNSTACAMLSRPGCPKPHVPATSLSRYRFPRKMSKSMARFYGRRHEEAFDVMALSKLEMPQQARESCFSSLAPGQGFCQQQDKGSWPRVGLALWGLKGQVVWRESGRLLGTWRGLQATPPQPRFSSELQKANWGGHLHPTSTYGQLSLGSEANTRVFHGNLSGFRTLLCCSDILRATGPEFRENAG